MKLEVGKMYVVTHQFNPDPPEESGVTFHKIKVVGIPDRELWKIIDSAYSSRSDNICGLFQFKQPFVVLEIKYPTPTGTPEHLILQTTSADSSCCLFGYMLMVCREDYGTDGDNDLKSWEIYEKHILWEVDIIKSEFKQ